MPIDESYNDVAARLREFFARYPRGAVQPVDPRRPFWVETIGDRAFVCYCAAAYRYPGDVLPGIGTAWEPFPGPTNFTLDSEVQNAETSAWGRAIVAVGAADTRRGVASRDEVEARSGPRLASEGQRRTLVAAIDGRGLPDGVPYPVPDDLTESAFRDYMARVRAHTPDTPPPVRASTLRDDEDRTPPAESGGVPAGPGSDPRRPWRRRPFPAGGTPEAVGRYWSTMIAAVPGIGPARLLAYARTSAADKGLAEPATLDDIRDPALVVALGTFLDLAVEDADAKVSA